MSDRRASLVRLAPLGVIVIAATTLLGQYALDELYVEIHPDDALPRAIADGDRVRVFNDLGEVACIARVTDRIRSGVVLIPKGAWRASSGSRVTAPPSRSVPCGASNQG